jgi:hypothetical protein
VAEELLFNVASWIVILGLLAVLIVALEIGRRLGRRARAAIDDGAKAQANALQSAIIGLLALLLAFALSMAISRYDARRHLLLDEANAIGTTYLRAKLLPQPHAADAARLLKEYVANRLELYDAGIDQARLRADAEQAAQLQDKLWSITVATSAQDNRAVPTGLFAQALNDTIDLAAVRAAAFQNRVPGAVIWLLFGVAAAAAAVVGYNNGLAAGRHVFGALILIVLLVATLWVTIDLDVAQHGLIRVSQQSMTTLQETIARDLP